MSRTSVRPLDHGDPLGQLTMLGPRMLMLSAEAAAGLVQGLARLLAPALAEGARTATEFRLGSLLPRSACCEIPETECPPRCVCEVTWEAACGETVAATIRVVNRSSATRTFSVTALPFPGLDPKEAAIAIEPASLELSPSTSAVVSASFVVPGEAHAAAHETEIVVRGAYEQCVRVILHVAERHRCADEAPHCVCEVVQGDPPPRIRAHHWYDHFQCTEPCGRSGTVLTWDHK